MADVVYVSELPACDIHKIDRNTVVPAAYDAKIRGRSSWASMCESCFTTHGIGLGTGLGQRYIVGSKPVTTTRFEDMSFDDLKELIGDGDPSDFF